MLDRNPASRWPTFTPSCPRPGARRPWRRIAPTRRNTASPTRWRPLRDDAAEGEKIAGHAIADLVTVNGVRVVTDDGTWGLVRASSNKPELVVVVESPVSEARMREMFKAVDGCCARSRGRRLQPDDLRCQGTESKSDFRRFLIFCIAYLTPDWGAACQRAFRSAAGWDRDRGGHASPRAS